MHCLSHAQTVSDAAPMTERVLTGSSFCVGPLSRYVTMGSISQDYDIPQLEADGTKLTGYHAKVRAYGHACLGRCANVRRQVT